MKQVFRCTCFLIICILSSCSLTNDRDLGNHYFLWEADGHFYKIIYGNIDAGVEVVGHIVEKVSFNDNYIIAKTKTYSTQNSFVEAFWLIDKTKRVDLKNKNWKQMVLTGPTDSVRLFKILSQKKIPLKLDSSSIVDPNNPAFK
jgi:hypothetical protein